MLPSRSSNEGSFVDLVGSLSNSLNTSTASSSKGNNFVEFDENDFKVHLSTESHGCFQTDGRALGVNQFDTSQLSSNQSGPDGIAALNRTDANVFVNQVNQSELNKLPGAHRNEQFKLIDLREDKDDKLSAVNSFDRFDCFFGSERPADNQRDSQSNSVQSIGKDRNLILSSRALDYCPAGRSDSSSSSNLTDENSNECDSFLKSTDTQTKYFNRIKKMSYKIKGVQLSV